MFFQRWKDITEIPIQHYTLTHQSSVEVHYTVFRLDWYRVVLNYIDDSIQNGKKY